MKKLWMISLLGFAPCLAWGSASIFNPITGALDYISNKNTTVVTSTATLTQTNSTVLASCTTHGASPNAWITITLPPATVNNGLSEGIHIYDVGTDSCSIRIAAAPGELIASTGTWRLDAQSQHCNIEPIGNGLWGGDCEATPWSVFTTQDDVGTFSVASSSLVTVCPIYFPTPVGFMGVRMNRATIGGNNNAVAALFDLNNKFIVQVATMTLTSGPNNYLTGTVTQLAKGYYKLAYTASNTTLAISGSNSVNSQKMFCGSAGTSTSGMDLSTFVPSVPLTGNNSTYPAIDVIVNGGLQGF